MTAYRRILMACTAVGLILAGPVAGQRIGLAAPAEPDSPGPLDRRISVAFDAAPLETALRDISYRAGVWLTYSREMVPLNRTVTLRAEHISVREAFESVLEGTGINVFLSPPRQVALVPTRQPVPAPTEQQTGVIAGTVLDRATGQGMSGVRVHLEGTRHGTFTNEAGRYLIANIPAGRYTVVASRIGYAATDARSVLIEPGETLIVDFSMDSAPLTLDELVVSGTIVETRRRELASPITVITAADIERRQVSNLNQLLVGTVPGLVSWSAPGRPSSPIEVRGKNSFESNYLKTYVDGVEVANPLYLGNIDPRSIERIEILRGPQASTIHGSDAAGGVIQIFTRRGQSGVERPQVRAQVAGGFIESQYAEDRAVHQDHAFSVTGAFGDGFSYHVGGSYRELGEWTPDLNTKVAGVFGSARFRHGPLVVDASARHAQFGFTLFRTPQLMEYPPFALPLNRDIDNVGETFSVQATYMATERWQHRLVAGLDRNFQETRQHSPVGSFPGDTLLEVSAWDHTKRSMGYNTTLQLPTPGGLTATLTAGFDHWTSDRTTWTVNNATLNETAEGGNVYRGTATRSTAAPRSNTGYFAQVQSGIRDALFLTGGLRAERNINFGPDFGMAYSPRVGAAYARDLGETTVKVRAGYGESSRPPNPTHSRVTGAPGSNNYTIANPHIGPERERGADMGFEVYFARGASIEATVYHQTSLDLISRVPLEPTAEVAIINQWQNVGEITNRGVELQGRIQFERLRFGGTLSFLSSRVGELAPGYTGALVPGDRMLGVPGHVAGLNVVYSLAGTSIGVDMSHVGSWTAPDQVAQIAAAFGAAPRLPNPRDYWMQYPSFTKFDATLSRRIGHRFRAFAVVNDLMDSNPIENNNLEVAHGRFSTIGLEVTF